MAQRYTKTDAREAFAQLCEHFNKRQYDPAAEDKHGSWRLYTHWEGPYWFRVEEWREHEYGGGWWDVFTSSRKTTREFCQFVNAILVADTISKESRGNQQ